MCKFTSTYLGGGKLLTRAVKKYGKENFKVDIIAYANTKRMLDILEIKYIAKYRQIFGKFMYNLTKGGEGTTGVIHSKKIRENMSIAHMGNHSAPTVDKDVLKKLTYSSLYREYITKKKTQGDVAKKFKCSRQTIARYLKKNNIPIRGVSEALKGNLRVVKAAIKRTFYFSPSQIKKMSNAKLGKSLSELGHKEECNCSCCYQKRGGKVYGTKS